MEEVDLNLSNYSLNDLLNLFKLNLNFTSQDFKNAKKIVLMTHPDKSGLEPKYFQFYTKAYELLFRVYKFKIKDEELSNKNINNEYFSHAMDNKNKDSDLIILKKIGLLNEDKSAAKGFSERFNTMFEKYYVNEDNEGYEDWLKSNEDEMPLNLHQNEVQRRMEEKRKNMSALININNIEEISSSSGVATSSFSSNEKINSYEAPVFSGLQYNDLKKAHVESIIPITQEDFENVPKFSNMDEYKRHRDITRRDFNWDKSMFEEKLRSQNQQSDIEDCNRYFNLMKEQEQMMERNKKFWKDLKQLTN
jgi:hypothetical protein